MARIKHINLAILNGKTEKDEDVGANGPNYNGIHHFGPDEVVFDISHPGWDVT